MFTILFYHSFLAIGNQYGKDNEIMHKQHNTAQIAPILTFVPW